MGSEQRAFPCLQVPAYHQASTPCVMVYAKGSTRTALPGSPRITKGSPSRNFLRRRLQVHPTQYHAIGPRPTSPAREHCELESTKSFNLTGLSVGIPMSSRAKLTFFCKTRESCKQCNVEMIRNAKNLKVLNQVLDKRICLLHSLEMRMPRRSWQDFPLGLRRFLSHLYDEIPRIMPRFLQSISHSQGTASSDAPGNRNMAPSSKVQGTSIQSLLRLLHKSQRVSSVPGST